MRSPRNIFVGVVATAALIIFFGYSSISKSQALNAMELKVELLHRTRDQMTAQLQVVAEHRQRLEQSLEDHKSKLQAVKEEAEKQHNKLKTTLDEANQRLHREALQRRQAEEAMEAARIEHERAYDELQKAKDDELQRLAESLSAQRRWCKQLQEKLDNRSKPKEAKTRPVLAASQAGGRDNMPAEASEEQQIRNNGAVPNVADDRQDLVQKASAASYSPPMAGVGGPLRLVDAGPAGRAAAQAQMNREAVDIGQQVAQVPAARDGVSDMNQKRNSALRNINQPDVTQGSRREAGSHSLPDLQAPAPPGPAGQPHPGNVVAQGNGAADAGRGVITEDYKGDHRQRVHDADEIAADPRAQLADGNVARDQLDNEEDDVDAKGRVVLDHQPGSDRDFGKDS